MLTCGKILSHPISTGYLEALCFDWSMYPGLCELTTQNRLRLVGSELDIEKQNLQDYHKNNCGCGDLNSKVHNRLMEFIIVMENFTKSFREHFTTSICLEWSNYIFLCDRNTRTNPPTLEPK